MKPVVHVETASTSGFNIALRQAQMQRHHDAGFSVCPVPSDGQDHVVCTRTAKVCEVCS